MKEHRHDSCFLVVAHFEVQQDTGHQYTKDTPIKGKKKLDRKIQLFKSFCKIHNITDQMFPN